MKINANELNSRQAHSLMLSPTIQKINRILQINIWIKKKLTIIESSPQPILSWAWGWYARSLSTTTFSSSGVRRSPSIYLTERRYSGALKLLPYNSAPQIVRWKILYTRNTVRWKNDMNRETDSMITMKKVVVSGWFCPSVSHDHHCTFIVFHSSWVNFCLFLITNKMR